MTDYSLNEVEALAKRACRGAGYAWGLAEDAGKAVRWLCAHHLPGMSTLADLLQAQDGVDLATLRPTSLGADWTSFSHQLCPLICGAALSDCADLVGTGGHVTMHGITHPLLVVPFAGFAARHTGGALELSWDNAKLTTDGDKLAMWSDDGLAPTAATRLTCRRLCRMPKPGRMPGQRAAVRTATWDALTCLAHRTYAPATEDSRLRGAGAGATDTD